MIAASEWYSDVRNIGETVLVVAAVLVLFGRIIVKPWIDNLTHNLKEELQRGQEELKSDFQDLKRKVEDSQIVLENHMRTEEITTRLFQNDITRMEARQSAMEAIVGFKVYEKQQGGA